MSEEETKEVDFSTLHLPFEKGRWRDADERMFHACFMILGQYVEDELGTESWFDEVPLYRGYRTHSSEGGDENAIDLWLWYKEDLPALMRDCSEDVKQCYVKDETATLGILRIREPKYPHHFIDDLKDKKLRELIDLRRTLWT